MEKDPVLEKYRNEGFGQNTMGWYFNPWIDEYDPEYDPHNDKEYNEELNKESDKKSNEEEIKWHPDLTAEQIEELIAEGIKPGDNEYDMYLWNHGIKPFDKENTAEKEDSVEVIKEPDDAIDHVIEPGHKEEQEDIKKEPDDVIDYVIEPENKEKPKDVIDYVIEPESEEEPEVGQEDIKTNNSLKIKEEPFFRRIWNKVKNIFNRNDNNKISEKSSIKIKRGFSPEVKDLLKTETLQEFNQKFIKIKKFNLKSEEMYAIRARMMELKIKQDKETGASQKYNSENFSSKTNVNRTTRKFTSIKLPRLRELGRNVVGGIKITGVKAWGKVTKENPAKTNMKTNNLREKYYAGDVDHNKAKEKVEKAKGKYKIDTSPIK